MVKSFVTSSFVLVHLALLSQISHCLPIETTRKEPLQQRELVEADRRGLVTDAMHVLPWVGLLGAGSVLAYKYLQGKNNGSNATTTPVSKENTPVDGGSVRKRSFHHFEERDWNELESRRLGVGELDELD
ncbi:hypothetical protein F5887DRAFT_1074868 [Amanita rubescens]|nr:hypothetical protein F5887DRAFT_1074868 [Amanita rubescens]